MYWQFGALDPALQDKLVQTWRTGGLGPSSCLGSRLGIRELIKCVPLGLAMTAGFAGAAAAVLANGYYLWTAYLGVVALLAAAWTVLLVAELVRGLRSPIRPFLLLTPKILLKADYAHGWIEAHRLRDATKFQAMEQYDDSQEYRGRRYTFKFPTGVVVFTPKSVADNAGVERILAAAREGTSPEAGSLGADLVPDSNGVPKLPPARSVTNPLSLGWALVSLWLVLAAIGLGVAIAILDALRN